MTGILFTYNVVQLQILTKLFLKTILIACNRRSLNLLIPYTWNIWVFNVPGWQTLSFLQAGWKFFIFLFCRSIHPNVSFESHKVCYCSHSIHVYVCLEPFAQEDTYGSSTKTPTGRNRPLAKNIPIPLVLSVLGMKYTKVQIEWKL